jgi:hypothetical protein
MASLWLMTLYAIIAFVLQALAVAVIYMFEGAIGSWSAVVFITVYLLMFWAAWPIALRLTEPKAEVVASAQKA